MEKRIPPPLQTLTPGWVLCCLCQPWMELCIMNKNCCQHALGSKTLEHMVCDYLYCQMQ